MRELSVKEQRVLDSEVKKLQNKGCKLTSLKDYDVIPNQDEISQWMSDNERKMSIQFVKSLLYCHINGLDSYVAVELYPPNGVPMTSKIYVMMENKDVILKNALNFFIDNELYEEASITRDVINILSYSDNI